MDRSLSCRSCDRPLTHTFVDLGTSPLSNAFIRPDALLEAEPNFPLTAYVCDACFLVQLPAIESPQHIFSDYVYFSSWSKSWLEHAQRYAEHAVARFKLGASSRVVEVASNDGYLLQYFQDAGVPALGIEPAGNVAQKARERGIDTVFDFFGQRLATTLVADHGGSDLLIGNNVLAHVPDLNDFVAGLRIMLKPGGTITLEFPHLLRLMDECQFDTIYHEHFSYFSLYSVERVFAAHGLHVWDVEELPTHGGSLRVYVRHHRAGANGHANGGESAAGAAPVSQRVEVLRARERAFGVDRLETYAGFAEQVRETKRALLDFLIEAKRAGRSVVGYGAPAKGNTLLNYCGIGTDFLDYTVDRSPHKQGLYLPGTRIPVHAPQRIAETKPDYVLILPWNLQDEIVADMRFIEEWGGRFVVPIPRVRVL
jgi:SAM-dependent methyltransferase